MKQSIYFVIILKYTYSSCIYHSLGDSLISKTSLRNLDLRPAQTCRNFSQPIENRFVQNTVGLRPIHEEMI